MRILAAILLVVVALMAWQHARYLSARRNAVQDAQPMFYSSDAFHVATFLETQEGADLIESVSGLVRAIEDAVRESSAGSSGRGSPYQSASVSAVHARLRSRWHRLHALGRPESTDFCRSGISIR